MKVLVEGLIRSNVILLDCANNRIGDEGAKAIANRMDDSGHWRVEEISLKRNLIESKGMDALKSGVANLTLPCPNVTVDLENNPFPFKKIQKNNCP